MLLLRRLHLWLGCLFAPTLIFFATTGTWQLYRAHDSKKDGSYTAPALVRTLSAVHMNSHLPGKRVTAYTPMRTFSTLAAAGLVFTTMLGIVMAYRMSRTVLAPTLCLMAGILIPVVIIAIYR